MNGKMYFNGLGTLVADPEFIESAGRNGLVKFRIAWNEKRKDEKIASFANIECWSEYLNKQIMQFFHKGKPIHVTGTIVEDTWEDKDGKKVRTYRFRLEGFDFLVDNKNESQGNDF